MRNRLGRFRAFTDPATCGFDCIAINYTSRQTAKLDTFYIENINNPTHLIRKWWAMPTLQVMLITCADDNVRRREDKISRRSSSQRIFRPWRPSRLRGLFIFLA
jgi:hypothetical protein